MMSGERKRRKKAKKYAEKCFQKFEKAYGEQLAKNAEAGHKKSGFNRITAHFVQGGSPGAGKKS